MHSCYSEGVAVSVTIRVVPDEIRDELAARAARAGQSLQEYLRGQLTELAAKPSPDLFWARVQARLETTKSHLTADQILDARDADRT
jgi:plasmid stability protein